MNNKKPLLFLVLIIVYFSTLHSQFSKEEADKILKENYKSGEPGATVLVAQKGKILYNEAFGMANLELDIPMKPNMVFEIGSITKQFTAISILMLVEEGKLSLEDDISKFIEDYPTQGHKITIHHLLTHTSGIRSYSNMESFGQIWRKDYKPLEFVDVFKNEPMDFAPGERYLYNNSAYFLLGVIIGKVSGISYADFLRQRIFDPLNMTNSYYGCHRMIIKNRASGYQFDNGYFMNAEYLSMTIPYSAGSIMSTTEDLWKWNKGLHNHELVSSETLKKAFINYPLNNGEKINYGYGWGINRIGKDLSYEHSGGIFGYLSNGIYIPEKDIYVAVLSNKQPSNPSLIAARLAGLTAGVHYPGTEDIIPLNSKQKNEYTGVYKLEDSTFRTITLEDDQLYSIRTGGSRFAIFPYEKDRFFFENSLTTLCFNRNKKGEIISVNSITRRAEETAIKTDIPIPTHEEKKLSPDIIKKYTGIYELQPGFNLNFTLEDGKFMSQATGQDKFELFPLSETIFFPKVVDAKFEFFPDENGTVNRAVLRQGGQEYELNRIK